MKLTSAIFAVIALGAVSGQAEAKNCQKGLYYCRDSLLKRGQYLSQINATGHNDAKDIYYCLGGRMGSIVWQDYCGGGCQDGGDDMTDYYYCLNALPSLSHLCATTMTPEASPAPSATPATESLKDTADRLFPAYLALTNELFAALHALAPPTSDFGLSRSMLLSYHNNNSNHPIAPRPQPPQPASAQKHLPLLLPAAVPPPPLASPHEPARILRQLVALDEDVKLFARRLEAHQKTQRELEDAQMALIDQEAGAMDLCRLANLKRFECDELVHEANTLLAKAAKSRNDPINVEAVTSYATRLAKYTMDAAAAHATPDRVHEPPIPQEQHMRMSLLFQEGHAMGAAAAADLDEDEAAAVGTPEQIPAFTFGADLTDHSPKKHGDTTGGSSHHDELLDLDFDEF
ncbi:hypothetical protein HDU88_004846 [Geranomyces variabilis]|nr:hypothetical protein HDU88_004846 [Geranomyces variabilis]